MAICNQSPFRSISIVPPTNLCRSDSSIFRNLTLKCNSSLHSKTLIIEPEPVCTSVKSFAPATVANLGPGFDFLGCAVDGVGDFVSLRVDPSVRPGEILISDINGVGNSAKKLSKDPLWNCAGIAAFSVMKMLGIQSVGLSLSLEKGLPLGSGLGSSAASAAAAAVAVNEIFGGKLSESDLVLAGLDSEAKVSGYHADNVAPAIMGGFVLIRSYDPLDIIQLKFPIEKELFFVLVNPEFEAPTKKMRAVLPSQISMKDHVWNCSQAGALVAAVLEGDLRGLGKALSSDKIVEPRRAPLIPGMEGVKRAAIKAGAFGCTISGAGPTAVAVTDDEERGREIGERMVEAFLKDGNLKALAMVRRLDREDLETEDSQFLYKNSKSAIFPGVGADVEIAGTGLMEEIEKGVLILTSFDGVLYCSLVAVFAVRNGDLGFWLLPCFFFSRRKTSEAYLSYFLMLLFFLSRLQIVLILVWIGSTNAKSQEHQLKWQGQEKRSKDIVSHSCIHDQILEQRRRPGLKEYSVTPQVYEESGFSKPLHSKGRALLGVPKLSEIQKDAWHPIRIYLNYDAVGHSPDRDCQSVGDIVKLGEPPVTRLPSTPACNPHGNPPIFGDCWYNCTLDDISGDDKSLRLRKALGQTADWFSRALAVEPVKGNLRLSGYSACGQDGGVQLPREYVEEGVSNADLVLLVTTRPTTGNTLAWAVACERDQWGRAIAGHVNVAPRHLTAEAETLLSATLIHEVMHVLGFDPHAFSHFRDERKRRRNQVTVQAIDEKLGRMVTRVVLPRVVMHSRYHYGAFSENFTGLELEDGGGRGTSGSHWEKRLLMNEIMTGSVDTRSVVSKMTLALLEDSGWYQANYSMADRLDWGRNQGAEFVMSPCNLWKGAYHCNTTQLSGCTYSREAEGYCPIVSYSGDLPQWARYFPQANKGGQSSLADYCTYFVAYSDGSCTDTSSARTPDRMLGEVRGSSSRCMASSLVRTGFVRGSTTQGNGCYQQRCVNNSLEVAVDNMWKLCPEAGGPVQFPGFNGELLCPAYHELCSTAPMPVSGQCPSSCSFNGDCVDGKCFCFLGFHGRDCSKRSCPGNCKGRGKCLRNGVCQCENGWTGIDCSTAVCDEQCSLHGGVCDNGVCEFRCSDYAGYTCQNSSTLLPSLSVCRYVLERDAIGQHCAPSESSILQQLEAAVVMPNYNRLIPVGRTLFSILDDGYCAAAAKRLACWISIQKCDKDGDNRLRVCHSACRSYNGACGACLDCSDQTLFSSEEEGEMQCTGFGEMRPWWLRHFRSFSSD
ncbi:hypothetical protein HHK36_030837 [Tetracentron sinense]|uniref:Homoserine kinase n=2 Tax=Magnoliopsida TaxID=3398 RepID=A0A834YAI9_TETSI|nr:hypothetical protein HHK36_030837 [Tetracentron sinense]